MAADDDDDGGGALIIICHTHAHTPTTINKYRVEGRKGRNRRGGGGKGGKLATDLD